MRWRKRRQTVDQLLTALRAAAIKARLGGASERQVAGTVVDVIEDFKKLR